MLRTMVILAAIGVATAWILRAADGTIPAPGDPVPAEEQIAALAPGQPVDLDAVVPARGWCVIAFTATW